MSTQRMKRIALTSVLALGMLTTPAWAGQKDDDKFDKAGETTRSGVDKGGDAAEKGLKGTGKGVGPAVEHTGRSLVKAGKTIVGKQDSKKQKPDTFDNAGEAVEGAFKTAGKATDKGLDAASKGTGAAVEHTGRGAVKAAKATGKTMERTGEAVADAFTDREADRGRVGDAQRILQEKGYCRGPIDGILGPKSRAGLREFQKDENLEVTGKLDDQTAGQLGLERRRGQRSVDSQCDGG